MKRTCTAIAFSVLIWSCSHKSTPTASKAAAAPAASGVAATQAAPAQDANVANVPATTTAPAPEANTKSPQMLGQATYTAKCGRCHGLKNTADYTADRWVGIMQSMAPKARLDDTEKANVLAYVQANAKK